MMQGLVIFNTSHTLSHCSDTVPIATRIGARLCTGDEGWVGGGGGGAEKTPPASSDQAKIRYSYTQPNTACSVRPSKDQTFIHTTQHGQLRQTKQGSNIHTHNPTPQATNTQSFCFVRPSKDQTLSIHTTQHHRQQTLSPSVSSDQARIRHYPYTQPNTTGNKHSVLLFRQTNQQCL